MHVVRLPGFRYREAASWLGEWQEEHGLNGAAIVGHPQGLASALRRIEATVRGLPLHDANPATAHMFIIQPFTGASLASLFSTHPPMDKRIAALLGRV